MTPGFVCTEESLYAVQAVPTPAESGAIEEYRATYRATFGRDPHGLHYLKDVGAVWLPAPEESGVAG